MATNRTAKRMLLAREIAYLMKKKGTDAETLAKALRVRTPKIGEVLAGRATVAAAELTLILEKLGVTDEGTVEQMFELWQDNYKRGFWTSGHRRAYSEDFRLMVDLELNADLIRSVETETMPGNAQCEAYVRAQFRARDDDEERIEQFVQARLARQDVLANEGMEYRVVMSESCLRRVRGGPEVMREQIDHLMKVSKRPNVMLQVIPFSAADAPSIEIRFIMVRVPSPGYAGPLEIAYVEGVGELRYLDDARALTAHDAKWARLSGAALTPVETRKFMRDVAASYRD